MTAGGESTIVSSSKVNKTDFRFVSQRYKKVLTQATESGIVSASTIIEHQMMFSLFENLVPVLSGKSNHDDERKQDNPKKFLTSLDSRWCNCCGEIREKALICNKFTAFCFHVDYTNDGWYVDDREILNKHLGSQLENRTRAIGVIG